MLTVKSCILELRGVANKTSKTGNVYYSINTETEDGTPYAFYCKDSSAFPSGLKKGDKVNIFFEVSYFKGQERLVAVEVVKAV